MTRTAFQPVILLFVGVALALSQGCGEPDPNEALARANSTNIQRLANLYVAYQSTHNWAGPPNEAALKDFIRTTPADKLARIGVDSSEADALFTSERDAQPFKIRYGVKGDSMGSSEPVVFEATGVDGKREVAFLNMTQREVDAAEYEALWSGKTPPLPTARAR